MKNLKESLLDDEEDLVDYDDFTDPKRFKQQLLKFNEGRIGIPNFYLDGFISLCEDIYYAKFGENMTADDCDKIVEESNLFAFTDMAKMNKDARNYIFMMLNKIMRANKGMFGINCPAVKNNYSFEDPNDGYYHKDLPYPGIKDAWDVMFDLPNGMGSGKIKQPILDVMTELNVINKSTETCKKATKYKVVLNNTPIRHSQKFSIMWVPSSLPNNFKEMIKIMIAELK